ncbi:DNA methyltransferase/prohead protease protein [Rhizobium phage RHph_TM3_3_9]|nr:DNA methyltransferase/prohead protease protein [Rhizobium phage RHph_TM3_3_9]QIG67860.1 DNA methyltransferase/prohead protease protein [Rhizobium phage RHph_Y60]QIG68573.1 DNA methyltransferase/prohead protease protein [Rhizobium phage RHph_TM3_3_13]QIG73366.1 DNA methyltransferase/prohead protease protein [Rhizobium phage RHph_Y5A]QIG74431.1 DNA methyltransferase/prohead protease protein [Rhizobium phage RHph_TM3_3_10]QIG75289.1 DNA methyltransferase/prohead protease protein [Rhizobium pha
MRTLTPIDADHSAIPFNYDGQILGSLREDQVPRFFGALTDTQSLPVMTFNVNALTAMQNRVSTGKVEAIRANADKTGKKPLVVIHNGKQYIADGHHRATAQWLDGADEFEAHYADISPVTNQVKLTKVNDSLGLVFGWAIISKIAGAEYFDTQGHYIPEDVMLKASSEYMQNDRIAKEMHVGGEKGKVVFAFPMTADIAEAMGVRSDQTGLMIAMKPDNESMLQKFRDGTYSGFSIGGSGELIPA